MERPWNCTDQKSTYRNYYWQNMEHTLLFSDFSGCWVGLNPNYLSTYVLNICITSTRRLRLTLWFVDLCFEARNRFNTSYYQHWVSNRVVTTIKFSTDDMQYLLRCHKTIFGSWGPPNHAFCNRKGLTVYNQWSNRLRQQLYCFLTRG